MQGNRKKGKTSLAGSLLLAHPAMRDPNFRRAVVLMSAHNSEGAMGVVLNRPLGRRLGELNGEFALGSLASVPLFEGGPVQPEQVLLVAWEDRIDGFRLHFGIEPDKAGQLIADGTAEVRAFRGYAGWSAGQLEGELKTGTWVVADVPSDLLTQNPGEAAWRAVLGAQGEHWKLLANEPDDPEAN